uniref:Uncharacterized protein n=1 Tax=Parastrongyloides trichosuri TaxID=131310 RepID=A0A0N4ZVV8_PARTI
MIKTSIFLLLLVALFNEAYESGKVCNGYDLTLRFKGEFLCQGQPSKTVKLYLESCILETGFCKKYIPELNQTGDVTTVTSPTIIDIFDEFDLIVEHECGQCTGAFKIPISEAAINCKNLPGGKIDDLKTIELADEKYC